MSAPILLIESDPDDQYLLERALRKAEVRNPIVQFPTVSGALEFLQSCVGLNPAFIIVDVGVFCRTGERIISWMGAQSLFKQSPIIAIGDSDRPQDAQVAFDLGANAYFAKGVDMNDLAKLIKELEFVSDLAENHHSEF